MLVAAAATLASSGVSANLGSIGEISNALRPLLGEGVGRLVFSVGVLGASLVAAIVCSLALAWGVGEVAGYRRSLEYRPFEAKWFYGVYVACVVGASALVWVVPDLVWLNISAQLLNAFLLPLVIGFEKVSRLSVRVAAAEHLITSPIVFPAVSKCLRRAEGWRAALPSASRVLAASVQKLL